MWERTKVVAPAKQWDQIAIGDLFLISYSGEVAFKISQDQLLVFGEDDPSEVPAVNSLSEYGFTVCYNDWMDDGFILIPSDQYNLAVNV